MPNMILNMPRLTITVTKDQCQWLQDEAKATNRKLSAVVRAALDCYQEALDRARKEEDTSTGG